MAKKAIMKPAFNQTIAEIQALAAAGNAVAGLIYQSSDDNAAGKPGVAYASENNELNWLITGTTNSDNIAMTLAPDGTISADAILAGSDNIMTAGADGFRVPELKIAAGSQGQLAYNAATNTLEMTALATKRTIVDETHTDLDSFISANYQNGDEYQAGDRIYLKAHTGGTRVYDNTVDEGQTPAGDATDFVLLEGPELEDSYIRSLIQDGDGLEYNPATGVMSADLH